MTLDRISVAGIRPQIASGDSIRPKGNHLRWMFPPQFGFPEQGFQVFRRQAGNIKTNQLVDFSRVSRMSSGQILDGVTFIYPNRTQMNVGRSPRGEAFLSVLPPSSLTLRLKFSRPVTKVSIEVGEVTGSITLRAFSGAFVVAEVRSGSRQPSTGSEFWDVAAPGITYVEFEMLFRELRNVGFLDESDDCNSPGWQLVAERLLLKNSDIATALSRLDDSETLSRGSSPDLRNRYTANHNEAKQKYRPHLDQLIEWVNLLQNPSASVFLNPGQTPDQLLIPAENSENPLQAIRPQSMLLLAALDPNIARILGLYWVDREAGENGGRYDYKVTGKWRKAQVGCGLVFNVGAEIAALPVISESLEGRQLPGIRWIRDKAYGRVGLNWPIPRSQQGAVSPILFDLYRKDEKTSQKEFLTKEKPILVSTQEETKSSLETFDFVDQSVPLGNYIYELRGIDLFGQVGDLIFSESVSVEDTQAPPPPLGLRAQLRQPGYPWRTERQLETLRSTNGKAQLELQFEFGELQLQQAPDARLFQIYWRQDDLFEIAEVTARADQSSIEVGGEIEYPLIITGLSQSELEKYKHGYITNVLDRGQTLPANQRRRFKITDVLAVNRLSLKISRREEFQEGTYKLISEPHTPITWTHLNQGGLAEIPVGNEVVGKLLQSGIQFNARVLSVIPLRQTTNSFSAFPAGVVPADTIENVPDEFQAKTEIILDIALADASPLVGGRLQFSGSEHMILYASGGDLSEESDQTVTRIGLTDHINLRPGDSCKILPASPFEAKVMRVQDGSKGTFIVDTDAVPSIFNLTNLIEGAITNLPTQQKYFSILGAEPNSDQLRLTVRPLKASDALPDVGSSILVTPPQFIELMIQEDSPIPDYAKNVVGGEVAFDEMIATDNGEEIKTHILRSLSGIYANRAGQFSILVRLPEQVIETLDLLIPNKPLRYHAPYRFQFDVDVVQRSDADLDLVIPPQEGTRRAYFAVLTQDEAGNSSPLTVPVQVTAVKPPPTGKPGRPYPCGLNEASEAGYATPPDRQGRATLCVAWKAGNLTPADGLRYEVARALDNSVVATDRQNWLLGKSVPGLPPVRVQIISTQPLADGVLEVTAQRAGAEPDYALAAFDKGLLHQGGENFRVQTVPTESGGNWVFQVIPESERELFQAEADLLPLPIAPGKKMRGEIGANITRQASGIFRVEVELASESRGAVEGLRHGKLTKPLSGGSGAEATPQGAQGGVPEHPTFQITGAQQGEGNRLILLLRPANFSVVPAEDGNGARQPMMVWRGEQRTLALSGDCLMEASPDYSRILTENEPLRKLAEKPGNEEAFGLVTGVPLKEEQARGMCGQQAGNGGSGQAQNQPFCFRDEIPGIGSNRFFYRVRAVDAADNRSPWSEVSVPFYQVDTTPPETPRDFQVFPGDRSIQLIWQTVKPSNVIGFHVFRNRSVLSTVKNINNNTPYKYLPLTDLEVVPLRAVSRTLVLPQPVTIEIDTNLEPMAIQSLLAAHTRVTAHSNPHGPNLFVAQSDLTQLTNRRIISLNPLVSEGTPVIVTLVKDGQEIQLTKQPGSNESLVIHNGTIDLSFASQISAIEGLFFAPSLPLDQDPTVSLARNYINTPGLTVDLATLTINGLEEILPEGTEVAVAVRFLDNTRTILRYAPGKHTPLMVKESRVELDIDITKYELVGVHVFGQPVTRHDLRLIDASAVDWSMDLTRQKVKIRSLIKLNPLISEQVPLIVTFEGTEDIPKFEADSGRVSWTDNEVVPHISFDYALAAIKMVQIAQVESEPRMIEISSPLTDTHRAAALNLSDPLPPSQVEVLWWDEAVAGPATPTSNNLSIRIVIQRPEMDIQRLLVQHSLFEEGVWRNVTTDIGEGWVNWPANQEQMTLLDRSAQPQENKKYRFIVRADDGRISPPHYVNIRARV